MKTERQAPKQNCPLKLLGVWVYWLYATCNFVSGRPFGGCMHAARSPADRYLARVIWRIAFLGLLAYLRHVRGPASDTLLPVKNDILDDLCLTDRWVPATTMAEPRGQLAGLSPL